MAPRIVELLGSHTNYFDLCCGSMSVLLAKPVSRQETAVDLYGDITNLALVLSDADRAVDLHNRLASVIFSDAVLAEAEKRMQSWNFLDSDSALDGDSAQPAGSLVPSTSRAFDFFIASWMGRGGEAGMDRVSFSIPVRFTTNGGSPTVRFRSAVDSIPEWHRRLQNVVMRSTLPPRKPSQRQISPRLHHRRSRATCWRVRAVP